ncbi:hypothetical protein AB0N65_00725 [Paenarthrobacter sp. NPDC089322]|uniref:hypothetical protein n=1 Tax=Paenarthrobacter sp. NPDC089322 TaxID=3155065 RepID=UPI0034369852
MARVPDEPAVPGPATSETEYEVIGGGMIDDRFPRHEGSVGEGHGSHPQPAFRVAFPAAWTDARRSFSSWKFWIACACALVLSWALAAAVVAFGEANGWFETTIPSAIYMLTAAWLAIASAVLGAIWGFRNPAISLLAAVIAAAFRAAALAVPAAVVLVVAGANVGGPLALAGAAVVVVVLEVVLFGLIGAGSRGTVKRTVPAVVLVTLIVAFLCVGNVVATIMLIPATMGTGQASVPVNVERDDSGRVVAYECVGRLRPVEVAHTERVAWMAASNPALLFGSLAADIVPREHDLAWVLSGLQMAADGPDREVPCLGGESSDGLAPPVPVALTGTAVQIGVAALLLVPGRLRSSRRMPAKPAA